MKLSDYIVQFIVSQKVDVIFGYIGGAITHIVDSVYQNDEIKFIQVYHEQTASFAAEGYSRGCNKVGVAVATSGPGATNMITGIADAYFDSIPTIFITGQVNTYEYKYDKPVRQQGFQETDIVSIVKPITKYAKLIDRPEMIRYELEKAFDIAKSGRPGPILLDIPMDIQIAEIDLATLESYTGETAKTPEFVPEAYRELFLESRRPIILAGGGIINASAEADLLKFAKGNGIPVVVSLMGKGAFPEDNNLFVGMVGSYGNRCANIGLANADLLIAIGTRLDTRQTGTLLERFLSKGKILHIDIDNEELKHNRIVCNRQVVNCDAKKFLAEMVQAKITFSSDKKEWLDYIARIKQEFSQQNDVNKNCKNDIPYKIMEVLNICSNDQQVYCVDIGQNQMFAAQMLKIRGKQRFITSGGMAPMGYSIPAAIGMSFATQHKKKIFAITGDGGFHISSQSLLLLSQYNLPIKVIVINNQSLGMIVQFQDLYFGAREVATTKEGGYLVPNIRSMASACGLAYAMIDADNIKDSNLLKKILSQKGPGVIEVITGGKTDVVPKLTVNTPIEDMSPKLTRKQLESAMKM